MSTTTRFAATLIVLTSAALSAQAQDDGASTSTEPTYRVAHATAAYGHATRSAAVPLATPATHQVDPETQPASTSSHHTHVYTPPVDPYGFAAVLNSYRASVGLPPVAYDPNLSAWASQNNAAQSRRGIGHHINPNCLQNCGWNYSDAWSVARGWMNSPGHRRNMLSPSITRFGIAYGPGPYWTMNAQ